MKCPQCKVYLGILDLLEAYPDYLFVAIQEHYYKSVCTTETGLKGITCVVGYSKSQNILNTMLNLLFCNISNPNVKYNFKPAMFASMFTCSQSPTTHQNGGIMGKTLLGMCLCEQTKQESSIRTFLIVVRNSTG